MTMVTDPNSGDGLLAEPDLEIQAPPDEWPEDLDCEGLAPRSGLLEPETPPIEELINDGVQGFPLNWLFVDLNS